MKFEINKVYNCDNLELMKIIPNNFIDLIYCDVLFGTGNNFKDYQDLNPIKKIIDKFYTPRIQEMYRLLKDTGSIYIHCDWRINHWIRLILDDVFGYDNFRNEIIWVLKGIAGYKSLSNSFIRGHDTIFYYFKKQIAFNKKYFPYDKEQLKRFVGIDENERRYKTITKTKRLYLDKTKGVPISDVWSDIANFQIIVNSKEKTGYYSQKPKKLLERIIKASSNEDDVIADFFCGSGTTLVMAKELNRNFIGCDISEKAVKITNKRLENKKLVGFL